MADIAALDAALRVVYLLEGLYAAALELPDLVEEDSPEHASLALVLSQKAGHVAALRSAGATAARPAPARVDYTAGSGSGEGPFLDVWEEPDEFYRVAQLLEDLGVRAVLGALGGSHAGAAAMPLAGVLAAAGRHAGRIRRLRVRVSGAGVRPWVSGVDPGWDFEEDAPDWAELSQAEVAERVYGRPGSPGAEDNRRQGAVTFPDWPPAHTEAFDEPMAAAGVASALALFLD